ncbi:MAG TPA: M28 family peptidase, partial [Bryobacteraceae bacterium]|nr:M28 family peptidase [Bryobacteraceae bacterium]
AIDVDHAMETVQLVYASDRYFTFPAFARTVDLLRKRLESSGLRQIEVDAAPADGRTQAGFWTMPLAWDAKAARLEVTHPESISLCNYAQEPACLGMWSGPTPDGGLETELVDLEAVRWADVKGKLVLTWQNSASLKAKLVQYGALGAVNAFSENPELRSSRQWINAWGDNGWAFTKSSTPLLSFSVTPAQAERLRALLAKGRVQVRASVDARYFEGAYPWLTAAIPGLDSGEEVLVLAHTAEQGAQDNATGVAASLEALRTIRKLIDSNVLPRPKRTIRLLLMPELYGSLRYIETHRQRMAATVASLTVDTPAASYDLAGTDYTLHLAPHSGKSWADALLPRVAHAVLPTRRPWRVAEHATGTDAYLSDPSIGVPNLWIYSGTGVVTHHNSADTPEKTDRRSLGDLIGMTAVYLYYAASAGQAETPWLAQIMLDAAHQELSASASAAVNAHAAGNAAAASFAFSRLDYIASRNEAALTTLNRLHPAGDPAETVRPALREFLALQKSRLTALGIQPYVPARPRGGPVVRRKRIGSLPLDELSPAQREGFPSGAWDRMVTFALYWCDGKRTVSEAADLTEMELGRPLTFDFHAYFRFLERHGYVDFKN